MPKSILQIVKTSCVQKTAQKNIKYARNEAVLKICHHAKAIAHAKSSLWVKILKFQKTCQNPFYKQFTLVVCKKQLQKTPNNREMKAFSKSAIMPSLQPLQNLHFRSKL